MDTTAESLEQGKGMGPLVIALAPEGQAKPSPVQAAAISKLALRDKDQKALAAVLRGQKELAVTEAQLKANKVPVLFVYGSREAVLLRKRVTESQKALPAATVKVVEKGDHLSTVANPEFHMAVLGFLRKHRE